MVTKTYRTIDPIATGANIVRLRKERGLTVRDLQSYFGFEEPQAIYKWQRGQSLPTVDNLYALGALLDVTMDEILVQTRPKLNTVKSEQRAQVACCSPHFYTGCLRCDGSLGWHRPFAARTDLALPGYSRSVGRIRGFQYNSDKVPENNEWRCKEAECKTKWAKCG